MPQLDSLLQIRIDDHRVCHRDMVQKAKCNFIITYFFTSMTVTKRHVMVPYKLKYVCVMGAHQPWVSF